MKKDWEFLYEIGMYVICNGLMGSRTNYRYFGESENKVCLGLTRRHGNFDRQSDDYSDGIESLYFKTKTAWFAYFKAKLR